MKRLFTAALLALASVAFGATTVPVQLLNPTGSTAGQVIRSTGSGTAPAWGSIATGDLPVVPVSKGGTNATTASGTALDNITGFASTGFLTRTGAGAYAFQSATNGITLGNLAQAAANTVLANVTGSTANVAAFAMPSCSSTSSILQYTSGTGFTCSTTIWASAPAIGGTTANTGRFTSLTVTTGGIGVTGGLTMATGAITPVSTLGITGTTTNDNASAGAVGEYPNNSTAGISLTTATTANVTTLASLAAGDYDVSCVVTFVPAGSTVPSILSAGVSTTSATLPGSNTGGYVQLASSFPAGAAQVMVSPTVRVSLASASTVYCVAQSTFTVSTMTVNGFIRARRIR